MLKMCCLARYKQGLFVSSGTQACIQGGQNKRNKHLTIKQSCSKKKKKRVVFFNYRCEIISTVIFPSVFVEFFSISVAEFLLLITGMCV